ncbi:MAG: hypothetical protein E7266_01485 [Lachnospiraceae bacterium]|nr:hypothetical protein [Lachnospiraceae bacterium]
MFKELIKKIKEFIEERNIGKDKIILIGLGVGLLIVGIIFNNDKEKVKKNEETPIQNEMFTEHYEEEYIEKMEKKLREILREVDGVGSVDVFISYESTAEKVVLKETPYDKSETMESDGDGGERVVVSQSFDEKVIYDSENNPYLVKTILPEITGVAVIAEGGDQPYVKEKINNIIKALFDIGVNKIAVVGK